MARRLYSTCATIFLLALLCARSEGEGVSRSDPQTEGERRLLEWDTTKKFEPSKSSFNGMTALGTKYVPLTAFETRSFVPKKGSAAPSFYTPEFLSSAAKDNQRSFSTSPAYLKEPTAFDSSFNSGKSPIESRMFSGAGKTAQTQTAATDANRPYLGPEAEKMKQKYTPETGPKGGISTGRQLTVEEVRAILNRNK